MPYKSYARKRPKHDPTDSFFYLSRQMAQFMMIFEAFNSQVGPVRTEMTVTQQIPILHICDLDRS